MLLAFLFTKHEGLDLSVVEDLAVLLLGFKVLAELNTEGMGVEGVASLEKDAVVPLKTLIFRE